MNRRAFKKLLAAGISPQEKEMLRASDSELSISDFNRTVCMRIIGDPVNDTDNNAVNDPVHDSVSKVDEDAAEELKQELQVFLSRYMSDHPEAHKWIILSCLELTFVEEKPMHPQSSAHWFCKDGKYYCPSMEESSVICRYCACQKAGDREGNICEN